MPVQLIAKPLGKRHQAVDPKDRRRAWLSAYEDTKWVLSDSPGCGSDEKTVDFDVRMADGRSLIYHTELYNSAKELLFWIRAGNYTRFDDAYRHKQYAETMLRLCYGLTSRGFYSFAALTSIDIDIICEEAAFGVDGLTGASALVRKMLGQYHSWEDVPPELRTRDAFHEADVIFNLNLPPKWALPEVRSEIEAATARINGKTIVSLAALKDEPITNQNVQLVTMLFEGLFALRDFIEATSISFRPFPEGAAQRAFNLGRGTTRTPVPPPELAMRLLENTTRYLVDHVDHVVKSYHDTLSSRRSEGWYARALEVGTQVRSIVTAAYILIAAFTARRAEEIKMLRRDCTAGNDSDGWWMKVYIEKTERQWTWIPVPGLVARAFNAVRSLTPDGEVDPDADLFQFHDIAQNKVVNLYPENLLDTFAESIGAREYANDNTKKTQTWTWVTRQFRRLFAVIFFYRYRGKIKTLAHHLRHFDSRMTNDYVTLDPDIHKLWDQEVWHHQIEIAREIVDGRVTYKGPMGKRLTTLVKRLREKFSSQVKVVSEAAGAALVRHLQMSEGAVVRQIRKNQLVLTPKLWVTCSCPRNRKGCEKAACRKAAGYNDNDVGPDFAAAGPTVCPECPFALIGPENIAYIEEQAQAMSASAQASAEYGNSIFASLQAANVVKITGFLEDLKAA